MEMLTLSLNLDSKTPLYHQLYTFIKAEIQEGRIPYNTKLPSKRKLSSYLSISQNTIQAAYDQLIEEGYITPVERKGFYVCQLDHIQKLQIKNEIDTRKNRSLQSDIIYDFSYHGVDIPTFPYKTWRKLMKEVINEYDTELLQQGDSLGYDKLRIALAEYLHQSRGVNCSEDQIIISSGTEILFQSLIQLLDRDFTYGIENPGYEKLNHLFTGNRAKFKAINIDQSGMILSEIEKSHANILCITPAHQFPSGEIMPINRRIQLLNWANEQDNRYLIEDDYDSEFKYSGKPIPALQGLDTNEKVIYMGSLSKSLAPTIRVSYMVLPPHLMKRYHEKLSYILCPVPIMEQKVLHQFIKEGYFERHLNKMRNIYRKKRELLIKAISELNCGIEILGADAGLHLLLRVPNNMSEDALISSARKYKIKVYGISKYYFNKNSIPPNPTIVIGYASMSEDEIRSAVQLLYKAWFIR
ncbi:PLP-dependent aminotransferase family protein [Mobilitalea sibirica]|uniref:PLP-dependent aminotransferase family protein n=1 Tax=Mobilitalea sibirica TaxID=1462919 RepID=A0A8J7H0A7_9FIRM|nr:PLP-dependent aminotransferase family protein [Mobilitalea sibirica]MBH1941784.1 PLP-dependent aminotransferase family protein [Mobilitalea sibirica]